MSLSTMAAGNSHDESASKASERQQVQSDAAALAIDLDMAPEQLDEARPMISKPNSAKKSLKALRCDSNAVWAYPKALVDLESAFSVRFGTLGTIEDQRYLRFELQYFLLANTVHGNKGPFLILDHLFTPEAATLLKFSHSAREVLLQVLQTMYEEFLAKHQKIQLDIAGMHESKRDMALVDQSAKQYRWLEAKVKSLANANAPACLQHFAAQLFYNYDHRQRYQPDLTALSYVGGASPNALWMGLPREVDEALIAAGAFASGQASQHRLEAKIKTLEIKNKTLEIKNKQLESRLDSQGSTMRRIDQESSKDRSAVSAALKNVNEVQKKIRGYDDMLKQHQEDLDRLATSRRTLDATMLSWSTQHSDIRSRVGDLEAYAFGWDNVSSYQKSKKRNVFDQDDRRNREDEVRAQVDYIGFDSNDPAAIQVEIHGIAGHVEDIKDEFEKVALRLNRVQAAVEKLAKIGSAGGKAAPGSITGKDKYARGDKEEGASENASSVSVHGRMGAAMENLLSKSSSGAKKRKLNEAA